MPQLDRLSACPDCAEPAEDEDLFCGACGTALRTAPVPALTAPEPAPELEAEPEPGTEAEPEAEPEPEPAAGAVAVTSEGAGDADGAAPDEDDFTLAPAGPLSGLVALVREGTAEPSDPAPVDPRRGSAPPATGPSPADPRAADLGMTDAGGTDPAVTDPRALRDDTPPDGGVRCVACVTGAVENDACAHCGHKQPRERDHMEHELHGVAAASDIGLRHHRNEDFFAVARTALPDGTPASVAVVCDGVSSAERSDQASAAAAEAASTALRGAVPRGVDTRQAMRDALITAAEAVDALATEEDAKAERNAPACTIVGVVVAGGLLTVGWIGDSRAYWVPEDRAAPPARLTEDDSWAAQMVAAGLMEEAAAYADSRAHAITGWLGADAYEVEPHTASFAPEGPGVVVVCTDGLWNYAESAEQMAAALPHDARSRPLRSARHLVGHALDGGGHDNVTVALVPFPAPAGRAEPGLTP